MPSEASARFQELEKAKKDWKKKFADTLQSILKDPDKQAKAFNEHESLSKIINGVTTNKYNRFDATSIQQALEEISNPDEQGTNKQYMPYLEDRSYGNIIRLLLGLLDGTSYSEENPTAIQIKEKTNIGDIFLCDAALGSAINSTLLEVSAESSPLSQLRQAIPDDHPSKEYLETFIIEFRNELRVIAKSIIINFITQQELNRYLPALALLEDRVRNLSKEDPYIKLGQKMLVELKAIKKETDSALAKGKTPNVTLAELTRAIKSVHATLDPTLIGDKATQRLQKATTMLGIINQLGGMTPKKTPTPSWKRKLAILGLVALGVAAIAASVALAIGTYGAASPLSVIGFKLGLSTLATAGILATKVTVAAASTYGAYRLFQPAKPSTEKLKESAKELETKIENNNKNTHKP